jgi:hypothetical protein
VKEYRLSVGFEDVIGDEDLIEIDVEDFGR